VPERSFILNGRRVTVDIEDDVRLLWVIRDVLNVRGPKYGCGINVCKACTSHINGRAANICSVPLSRIGPDDEVTTIEGLGDPDNLHPMQEAWLDHDVAQCGYCQPGQIMAAVDLANKVHAEGREITDEDIDNNIRNVCRCGTYYRIRQAMKDGAKRMQMQGS
jgi:isoquinoline 1-oxidoreductase subunit alpha